MDNIIGIIPARYNSTRFPGKPLATIGGMTVIEHVYRRAAMALDTVYVATDDSRIVREVSRFGGRAILTEGVCRNGTERCVLALRQLNVKPDGIVNIQGDEPFVDPADILAVARTLSSGDTDIASIARRFDPADGFEALFSKDAVKVVMDSNMNAMYFSRSIIPYVRDTPWQQWLESTDFYIHVGLYGFRYEALSAITSLPPSPCEQAERLEQLRWLSAGYRIRMALTQSRTIGIDTPADLERAREFFIQTQTK